MKVDIKRDGVDETPVPNERLQWYRIQLQRERTIRGDSSPDERDLKSSGAPARYLTILH